MFGRMPLSSASAFLDLGCGAGAVLVAASEVGPRLLVGVDVDPEALEVARRQLNAAGARSYALVRADITRLPFAAGTFSHVCARLSLPYVDQRLAFESLAHTLEAGGSAFLQLHGFRFYLKRGWRELGQWKRVLLNGFCLLNGLVFQVTGRQMRLRLSKGRYQELAQPAFRTRRGLAAAGLQVTWIARGRLFQMMASKAAAGDARRTRKIQADRLSAAS
jgi:SAM-dependent methyltransferase